MKYSYNSQTREYLIENPYNGQKILMTTEQLNELMDFIIYIEAIEHSGIAKEKEYNEQN